MSAGGRLASPWGEVWGHDHRFRFSDVESEDKVILPLRDPISRFLSGYFSRRRKGAPRYLIEWTAAERRSFEWFPTPQALADALAEPPGELRERAELAMESIRHLNRPMTFWTGKPSYLLKHVEQIVFVARQETLDDDWEKLKDLLNLPREQMLPHDEITAHRTTYDGDRDISDKGVAALREWYADDYELIEIGDELRAGRVPARPSRLERITVPLAARLQRRSADT
jgi:hypothetical protein